MADLRGGVPTGVVPTAPPSSTATNITTTTSSSSSGITDAPMVAVEMDPVEYTLRKRLPRKLPKRRNDVYVNMKTDFKAQLARCQKLLDGGGAGGHREICIHGLGLAINRAINIALQLQASSQGALQLAANTSTVELVDDLEPDDPDADMGEPMTRTRNNSAIHIKVFYPDPQSSS
ncbi:ribonuclease P protein subunit p20 [Engraulis encrasicolus]|uniref:ribonuclease P protein subunit p20 n=1 Tax=Engraulis encrasicolus TaxID=184585 RepID=UPI002FD6BFFD